MSLNSAKWYKCCNILAVDVASLIFDFSAGVNALSRNGTDRIKHGKNNKKSVNSDRCRVYGHWMFR